MADRPVEAPPSPQHILLVCTIGGAPEAIAAGIAAWKPARIVFIPSPETRALAAVALSQAESLGIRLTPGQYDYHQVPDAQDFTGCIERLRELAPEVQKWAARGKEYVVVADITGGTKCMSAALALTASRWPCRFSYVGGSERTKSGVGVVVNGKEQVLHSQNPWDALGYQAVEDAVALFDRGDYEAAAAVMGDAIKAVGRADLKRELNACKLLAEAYREWDGFHHKEACGKLAELLKSGNDLRHRFSSEAQRLLTTIREHVTFLEKIRAGAPTSETIKDLLGNAMRCGERGKYDDGVARLYRTIEALAQIRLNDPTYGIANTGKCPLDKLPDELRVKWQSSATDGVVALGLQKAYELLSATGDDLGRRFYQLELDARHHSALESRNQSILAHGFSPVGSKVFNDLFGKALLLAGIEKRDLPRFPLISPGRPTGIP